MEIALSSQLQMQATLAPPRTRRRRSRKSIVPGFGLTMGFTLTWISLVVLIPLSALFIRAAGLGWSEFLAVGFSERALAAYRVSFGTAIAAASLNAVFGLLCAWVFVRYEFPGKRVLNAMVDLPFALPTAVAGIALTALYSPNGWVGRFFEALGVKVAYTPIGIIIALIFISLPFIVRSVEPVLADVRNDAEEAALSLGARPWQVFLRVILPAIMPALLTGFALALARAIGEYGSVIFIAGNMPYRSEIAPLLIVTQLEQYEYAAATAIATVLLLASFAMLLLINGIQAWTSRKVEQ
jgi:sulfate transport system permease protein